MRTRPNQHASRPAGALTEGMIDSPAQRTAVVAGTVATVVPILAGPPAALTAQDPVQIEALVGTLTVRAPDLDAGSRGRVRRTEGLPLDGGVFPSIG